MESITVSRNGAQNMGLVSVVRRERIFLDPIALPPLSLPRWAITYHSASPYPRGRTTRHCGRRVVFMRMVPDAHTLYCDLTECLPVLGGGEFTRMLCQGGERGAWTTIEFIKVSLRTGTAVAQAYRARTATRIEIRDLGSRRSNCQSLTSAFPRASIEIFIRAFQP